MPHFSVVKSSRFVYYYLNKATMMVGWIFTNDTIIILCAVVDDESIPPAFVIPFVSFIEPIQKQNNSKDIL